MLLSLVSHKSFFKSCSQIPTGPMARGGKNPALPSPNLLLTLISWKLITWRLLHGLLDVFVSPSDDLAVLKGSGHSPREEWGCGQACVHPLECRARLATTHPPCIPAPNPFLFPPKCSHFGDRSRGATSQSPKLQINEGK